MFYPYFPLPPNEWWEASSRNLRVILEASEALQRRHLLLGEAMMGQRAWTDKELLALWQEKGAAGMLAWYRMLPFHLAQITPWSDLIAASNMCLPTHARARTAARKQTPQSRKKK